MDKRLQECIRGEWDSYIFPFLWLHGESKERIREEILAIKNSGISEFCAESRPHEDFCKDKWWSDFGFVLKTARELGMGVWLLDDKKFPTGYANGYLENPDLAHLRKKLIREKQTDVVGPMKNAKVWVQGWLTEGEEIIKVIAYRHSDNKEGLDYKSAIDLTSTLKDGMACFDIPKGVWRVCTTISAKPEFVYDGRLCYYIDMLSKDSCQAMIDAVYQPHYEHFKEYFGNTFRGFFSDEPGFLNQSNSYSNKTGIMYERYPWREDLPALIAKSASLTQTEAELMIPALWEDLGEATSVLRMHYMEVITGLYKESFGDMLGSWAREHGVMYIGHVIEDMGAHIRMAYGSGHYFRALDGQDMAGIDVVLMQDIPGLDSCIHRSPLADGGIAKPEFFRYTMPKLASSHSHIQPLKDGRAMCEIFGAFSWAEGLPFMKGLADIMLSRGINRFVPHAFSPKEEDEDCPPHFYNGGKNIHYPLFKNLMEYMGRVSHMMSQGRHCADVAVFYNAEGEWTGGENQIFDKVCHRLATNLIDFDIVPYDYLKNAKVENGRLIVNNEDFGALIVSRSEIMPIDRLECFNRLAKEGLKVIFTDSLPQKSAEGVDISELISDFISVKTDSLNEYLRENGLCHVDGEKAQGLCFYHITRKGRDIYLFSNESVNENLDATIFLNQSGECLIYEPWGNCLYRDSVANGRLSLNIEKGNMLIVIFGEDDISAYPKFKKEADRIEIKPVFDIFVRDECSDAYEQIASTCDLVDITSLDKMTRFSGEIVYTATLNCKEGYTVLDLGQVGETAQVWLNDTYLGARINAPYKFDLSPALLSKENKLRVSVNSNLGHKRREWLLSYMQIPPSGILGEISLCKYE